MLPDPVGGQYLVKPIPGNITDPENEACTATIVKVDTHFQATEFAMNTDLSNLVPGDVIYYSPDATTTAVTVGEDEYELISYMYILGIKKQAVIPQKMN